MNNTLLDRYAPMIQSNYAIKISALNSITNILLLSIVKYEEILVRKHI